MSIKKRLILSNIGMVVIPILALIIVELAAGYLFFYVLGRKPEGEDMQVFQTFRFAAMIVILAITSGILTYSISRSILNPIERLSETAKKISENDLDHSCASDQKHELGQLSNTFEDLRLKLKKAAAVQQQYEVSRQELIASISHDLKTPLTSIKGYVSGIQDGVAGTPEKLNRYLSKIEKNAHEMDVLIDELFLYSKLDLEQIPFAFEKVKLDDYFHDFIEELSLTLEQEQGKAVLIYDPLQSYIVEADREKLNRVVMNISQNSLKYMDKSVKEVQIILSGREKEVQVEIKDNGSGIRKKDIDHIFDSFYRTDESRNSSTGGTGLGLSIAKKIIEKHGGKIWAASEPGVGTSIYFTLKKVNEREENIDN
ncbi:HAMP domain-containing sensor histidine kinase [Metabacillus indicus]|uniref:sensor histidine kinase n=1 Tax=Metabacillus indicus TaxID=246786 RepID=UPI002A01C6E7|nr:HAMP domain-containing sensor histidine kinase [Metabacillus indicus]MDX8291019.1 HAMP domain-containing sensor histidine kinase [Metabacillus indicus]